MSPYITIIIPTYNRSALISKTVNSIINQSFTQWECIIVDDHSTDDTKAVVNKIMERDNRISYCINERKKGAQGARNTGLYRAKSDWVFFFDSDNIMRPTLLENLVSRIYKGIDVITCFSDIIDVEKGATGRQLKSINEGNIHKQLFTGQCYVDFNHAIIRNNNLLEIGGLDEDCPSMQEWDTHIRLSKKAYYTTVPKALVDYYVGGKDAISTNKKREVIGRLYILCKHRKEWNKYKDGQIKLVKEILFLIRQNSEKTFRYFTYFRLFLNAPYALYKIIKDNIKTDLYKLLKHK